MENKAHYKDFGNLLIRLREKAGIAQQSELAKLIECTQQTISRWELGHSRPRHNQIFTLAAALNSEASELLAAAGYSEKIAVASFAKLFPVDSLSPENFERFCFYFLTILYRKEGAEVHRAGTSGHTQDGIDIDATFPKNIIYTFQCKRVEKFGPKKVKVAVEKHIKKATKKHLLLSCSASPQARETIRLYPTWKIWDKEDISEKVRSLPKDEQIRLVDIFFSGQRFALLGETEAGPWQKFENFFEPFIDKNSVFNHQWRIVGRAQETQDIVAVLSDPQKKLILVTGSGGIGKSRILKEAIGTYQKKHREVSVFFLSQSQEATNKSLENLGNGQKILIVDDAHDAINLQLLFKYAGSPSNNAKLLLAFRPYGLDLIKAQAGSFSLIGDNISTIPLQDLDLKQTTVLAMQVLKEKGFKGPKNMAEQIADYTRDCPLATVIGAQIVAKENILFELVKNNNLFREALFSRFQKVITGDIGNRNDGNSISKLLGAIALVQPFHPKDESIIAMIEKVNGIPSHEVGRLIELLIKAGVLFKRGGKCRLSPDMLADFIIEDKCIRDGGGSTGYAEKLFDESNATHIKHILLNLGKLDWRRKNGDQKESQLLDGIWNKLKFSGEFCDLNIEAVTAVAYYQPKHALDFTERVMREGKHLNKLPELLKYVAYNLDYLPEACKCLWELQKNNKNRDQADQYQKQHPGKAAIQTLSELCEVSPNKDRKYSEKIVEFGILLLGKEDSWTHSYTPFDVLKPILQTEGRTTELKGDTICFGKFSIPFDFIITLRNKVIDATIELLSHKNIKIAVFAAEFIKETIRYSVSGNDREIWEKEFVLTLKKIERAIQAQQLDSLVLIQIARSISWCANYANDKTTPIAKRIIKSLPCSIEFQTTLMLIDGGTSLFIKAELNYYEQDIEHNKRLKKLADSILENYPNPHELYVFIEKILLHIALNCRAAPHSFPLCEKLTQSSLPFAQIVLKNVLENPGSETIQLAGSAFTKLLIENHKSAVKTASDFLNTGIPNLGDIVSRYYRVAKYEESDLILLQRMLTSAHENIILNTINAVQNFSKQDGRRAIDLLKQVDFRISKNITDRVLALFRDDGEISFQSLTEEDVEHFFNKLMQLPELDAYWIDTFLANASKCHSKRTARFFMNRVELAAKTQRYDYYPCNYESSNRIPLCFRESPEFRLLVRETLEWMRSHQNDNCVFYDGSSKLFKTMFGNLDDALLTFLTEWIDVATSADFRIISQILREAQNCLVFEHKDFVIRYLEKVKQYDNDCYEDALSALFASAFYGIRAGTLGEPFQRDILLKTESEKILQEISEFSAAYLLYKNLKESAEQNIKLSFQERENLDG